MARRRWRVDIYYSGFTTVEVMATEEDEAVREGRELACERLGKGAVLDEDGALRQLIENLEPWPSCDTAEPAEHSQRDQEAER